MKKDGRHRREDKVNLCWKRGQYWVLSGKGGLELTFEIFNLKEQVGL